MPKTPTRTPNRAKRTKRPVGRPTLYKQVYVEIGFEQALLGSTDAQLAAVIGVDEDTVQEWKRRHPEFSASIARGKAIADGRVARGLYERATGYSHDAVKIFMPAGAKEPVYAPYVEHHPPDTAAASLWLRNRQPKLWREKTDLNVSGQISLEHWVLDSGLGTGAEPAIAVEDYREK
jgi:hypothetical protein